MCVPKFKSVLVIGILAAIWAVSPGVAEAGPIFSRNLDGRGGLAINPDDVSLRFSLFRGTDQSVGQELPLFQIQFTGQSLILSLDSSSGQSFVEAVTLLTNGINDSNNLFVSLLDNDVGSGSLGFGVGSDALTFYGDATGASGIDLSGRTIDRITLEIQGLFLNSPGNNPNGDGFWTDVALFSKLSIYGSGESLRLWDDPNRLVVDPLSTTTVVPEPSSLVLLVLGGLGSMAVRFLQWRRHDGEGRPEPSAAPNRGGS